VALPRESRHDDTTEHRFAALLGDAVQPVRALMVRTCDDPEGWPLAEVRIEIGQAPHVPTVDESAA
jgi:hypothetical protein